MQTSHTPEPAPIGFFGLGIAPGILETLARLGYTAPTKIQSQAIPIAIQGKDVVGIAQTGTGKTLAFGIPIVQRLAETRGRGLVVLPTRELAVQVDEALKKVGKNIGITTAILIGGAAMGPQLHALRQNPAVIIATPGRLLDHLQQRTLKLDGIKIVVLDEADRMLDMGFMPQIKRIFEALPKERQTMLFSATMPPEIMKMASAYLKIPVRIEVVPAGTPAEKISQEIFLVRKAEKPRLLEKLLYQYTGTTLIFTRTKHGAKRVMRAVRELGHTAAELHSNRSLTQRRDALEGFKSGRYRVLVATDIASRGIDVIGIELVLNFDLPMQSEDYIHRIGRTARAGASGHAITFVMPEERRGLMSIERLMRKRIPVSTLPELPPERPMPKEHFDSSRPSRRPFSRSSSGSSSRPYSPKPFSRGASAPSSRPYSPKSSSHSPSAPSSRPYSGGHTRPGGSSTSRPFSRPGGPSSRPRFGGPRDGKFRSPHSSGNSSRFSRDRRDRNPRV